MAGSCRASLYKCKKRRVSHFPAFPCISLSPKTTPAGRALPPPSAPLPLQIREEYDKMCTEHAELKKSIAALEGIQGWRAEVAQLEQVGAGPGTCG